MDIALLLSILGAIAVFAAALKALPIIWGGLKSIGKFVSGLEKTADLPALIVNQNQLLENSETNKGLLDSLTITLQGAVGSIKSLHDELVAHMEEEERLRSEERSLVEVMANSVEQLSQELSESTFRVADVVFRQAVFADPMAYYTISKNQEGKWDWTWGNSAYFRLTGLTALQAQSGQFWDIVEPSQAERVKAAAVKAGDEGTPLDVEFTSINVSTGVSNHVQVLAWPIHDKSGNPVLYLGAIQVLADGTERWD